MLSTEIPTSSDITTTDLFCGAGGSGIGAKAAGVRLVIAANHWQKAIDTHATNFPEVEHDCADISQVNPLRYPYTTLLWASPECTNFSQAKGGKLDTRRKKPDANGETLPDEAAERSRATMWDVPRFAERHRYKVIIVENVVEAASWVMFPAWLHAMDCLGYDHQIVSLNSMHAPAQKAPRAPQSRNRMYVVFHRKFNRKPDVTPRPLSFCQACGHECLAVQTWKNGRTIGRYREQYIYRCPEGHTVEPYALAAASAIDWSLPGERIGDKPVKDFYDKQGNYLGTGPLAPRTMDRIRVGLDRYASSDGLVIPLEGRDGKVATPIEDPMRTMTTRAETGLVVPYRRTSIPSSTALPMPTMTTVDPAALVVPPEAFIASLRGMNASHGKALRTVQEPLFGVTAGGNHHMLVQPQTTDLLLTANLDDARFRMLNPGEIKRAMAFGAEYVVVGNRREQVRQLGNGVTPPAAEFLYRAVVESLS